jgi:hypothetical protein
MRKYLSESIIIANDIEVKVTVKLSLCLIKHRAMKTNGGVEV